MTSRKKSSNPDVKKRYKILAGISGIILSLVCFVWIRSYLSERQAIEVLSSSTNELRIAYDNLLEDNKGNILSSSFRNSCSISNVSWLEQRVACGPSGDISLKNPVDLKTAAAYLNETTSVVGDEIGFSEIEVGQSSVNVSSKPDETDVRCSMNYGQNIVTKTWSYDLVCRKNVGRVLAGYTVE